METFAKKYTCVCKLFINENCTKQGSKGTFNTYIALSNSNMSKDN